MIVAREPVVGETALKGHAANGKPRARGATRKGSGVNCDNHLPCGESKPQLTPDPVAAALPREAEAAVPREQVCSRLEKKSRKRRAWQPQARDHYIYHLVKFEGHTQGEVASMQRISQPTVSRIIDRYERWQAHADPREGGRLDPAERLRAQRWLTYERNELILGSALRIAKAVEGTAELWKTVRTEPGDPYRTDKASVRDETSMIDRTGVAARFLRLAFKVNMEQLALVEKDPPPLPETLNEEEIAEEERQDAAVAEEFEAARQTPPEAPLAGTKPGLGEPAMAGELAVHREQVCSLLGDEEAADSIQNMNKVNNEDLGNSSASKDAAEVCAAGSVAEKIIADSCITEFDNTSRAHEQESPCRQWAEPTLACASG